MQSRSLILITILVGILGCREISIGSEGIDLITSESWGRPKDILKIDQYELWWYEFHDIDNIIFLREGRVIGQLKSGVQEKMWEVSRDWARYANRSEAYRLNLDKYVQDILRHHLRIGMKPDEVRLAWGHPVREQTQKHHTKYGMREEWLYQRDLYRPTQLVFTNGILTDIRND